MRLSTKLRWLTLVAVCLIITSLTFGWIAGFDTFASLIEAFAAILLIIHIKRVLGIYGTISFLAYAEESARQERNAWYANQPKKVCEACNQYFKDHKQIWRGDKAWVVCPEKKELTK